MNTQRGDRPSQRRLTWSCWIIESFFVGHVPLILRVRSTRVTMMQRKVQSWFEYPGQLSDVFLVGQLALCGTTHQPLAVLIIILAAVRPARDRIALSNFHTANRKPDYLIVIENIHYESRAILSLQTTRDALLPLAHNSVCQRQPEEIRIHKGGSAVDWLADPLLKHFRICLTSRSNWSSDSRHCGLKPPVLLQQ
ncbi:hypothetical protein NA56DRAFT_699359 [Hyaloscypha hepaticicola]|uniref:Uncharacterized protein n=1 Tax=Hyaloscypha hepaticicola TaxID=2082293 RepID=A0A2J6QGN5_9HELO|nr:hypothetical protein NA56DRAFT_699359 [Hyaloscypha hepaticicola]